MKRGSFESPAPSSYIVRTADLELQLPSQLVFAPGGYRIGGRLWFQKPVIFLTFVFLIPVCSLARDPQLPSQPAVSLHGISVLLVCNSLAFAESYVPWYVHPYSTRRAMRISILFTSCQVLPYIQS